MPDSLVPVVMLIAIIALTILLLLTGPDDAVTATTPFALTAYHGVVQVSIGYAAVYYIHIGTQVNVKLAAKDNEAMNKIAERGLLNTLEQMPLFLLGMWLHAIFVNPRTTAAIGWFYVVPRALYPTAYGFYGQFTILVEALTCMNYAAIGWFYAALAFKSFGNVDMHTTINDISPWLMPPGALIGFVAIAICFWVFGPVGSASIMRGVRWDESSAASGEGGGLQQELQESA